MTSLFYIVGLMLGALGGLFFLGSETVMQEISGAVVTLVGTVFFVGAFLSDTIQNATVDVVNALKERE